MKVSFSSNKKNDATVENHVKIPYAASKRAFPHVRWGLILLIIGSPFIILLGKMAWGWFFVSSPGTIWMEKKTINAIEPGTVEKVFYRIGDTANANTVMFRVKRKISENRLEQLAFLEAERDAAKTEMKSETVSATINSRKNVSEIKLAQENVAYYQKVRDETKWLLDQGAATRAEMDIAENRLREAKAALIALSMPEASSAISSVSPARKAQVEQSINSLKKMTEEYFDIKSGQGGKVSAVFVSDGQSFSAGEPLAVVMDTQQVHVVTYVDPNDFKKISIGTPAIVKILGTNRKIKAVVQKPPVVAEHIPKGISDQFYPVTMRGVQIFLKVLEPLQDEELIEGLPVAVEW